MSSNIKKEIRQLWRKSGNNYVSGTNVLNIRNKYSGNTLIGYDVDFYDFSKYVDNPKGRTLKTLKTKKEAVKWRLKYMKGLF